jgi:hypothetical protein
MPAVPPYIIEPVWEQFRALLPERTRRGSSARLSPHSYPRQGGLREVGASVGLRLRLPQDLRRGVLRHYLAPSARRVDRGRRHGRPRRDREGLLRPYRRSGALRGGGGLLHHEGPLRWREGGQKPGGPRKTGHQTFGGGGRRRHPLGHRHRAGQPPRLAAVVGDTGLRTGAGFASRGGKRSPGSRLRLGDHPPQTAGSWLGGGDFRERPTRPGGRHRTMDRRAHQLVAKRPQEAGVVYGTTSTGGRFLGGLLERGPHRWEAHPGSLETLPLGGPALSPAMT